MIKIVIIGSGNVAEALVKAFSGSEALSGSGSVRYELTQVYARNKIRAQELASIARCGYACVPEELAQAEVYLIAVSDRAIGQITEELEFGSGVVAHTAGSAGINEISSQVENTGVFYPLQTFTQGRDVDFRMIPVFIEGNNAHALNVLKELAGSISSSVMECDSAQRVKLHLAAVFACNFTNHMYAIAQDILGQEDIPARVLVPLIGETAAKAMSARLADEVQTGPAVRNDSATLNKHIGILAGDERLQNIYKNISSSIWETSKKTSRKSGQ